MIWPEKLYKFTKVQGAITTYTYQGIKDTLGNVFGVYVSNYGQTSWISQEKLVNYHTSLEDCYEAWIESIEKFKEKVIKQFENKCKIDYNKWRQAKFKAWLDTQPDIKSRVKKVKDELV